MLKINNNFVPSGEYILMESLEPEKITPAGIIIPQYNRIQKPIGRVKKVGKKVTECKPGDVFFHVQFFGIKCDLQGKTHYIMRASDVIGRF